MNLVRRLLSFPVAWMISIATYFIAEVFLSSAIYSHDSLLYSIVGLAPLIIRTAVPTVVFVLVATLIHPSTKRGVVFVFFGLSLMFSGGGIESLPHYQLGNTVFWLASLVGIIVGGLIGLGLTLRLLAWRTARLKKGGAGLPNVTA